MEVITPYSYLLNYIGNIAYTQYQLEERSSGWHVILSTPTEETVFELVEALTDERMRRLKARLELFK